MTRDGSLGFFGRNERQSANPARVLHLRWVHGDVLGNHRSRRTCPKCLLRTSDSLAAPPQAGCPQRDQIAVQAFGVEEELVDRAGR